MSKKYTKELIKNLSNATNEKDVEHAYWQCFSSYYPSCINSQNRTDGLLICKDITSLMEFKYDTNLKSKLESASIVLQSLFYLKKMEKQGNILPKSIFIGDKDECFCVNIVPPIAKYLVTNEIDWNTSASKSPTNYPQLVKKIAEDNDINPFIYNVNIDLKFDFDGIIKILSEMEKGEVYPITITNENIIEIFNYFISYVIKDRKYDANTLFDELNSAAAIKLADVFMNCLTDKDSTYLHPKKKNVLVSRGEEIKVDTNLFNSFFLHFRQEYTPKELEVVVSNKDRIFEEIYRRKTGAYFTPPIWVKESQKMISEVLGDNWRDEYIVWDCACGTANLTRDNNFKELYLSTLEEGDINTIKDMGFNKGATIFKYDFLSEVGIDGVPEALKKAMKEGKKVLFYINPPYGTASGNKSKNKVKSNIAVNAIQEKMVKAKYGDAQKQLYTQFLYKIRSLQKQYNCSIAIGLFSPTAFLTGCYYKKFRNDFLDSFILGDGYIMSSTEFSDVGSAWGLSFSVWKTDKTSNKNNFIFHLKELDRKTFTINRLARKTVYNITNEQDASYWIRSNIKNYSKFDAPQLSSGINVRKNGGGKICLNAIGYIYCAGNSIQTNNTNISLSSCFHGNSQGFAFCVEDFNNIVSYFTARKSITPNWINCKDEYMIPNTLHPEYAQWNNDAIIYSLFNNSSQQSSLRDIDYKNKKWDILNHFFFMSNTEMLEMANKYNFNEMYQDAKRFKEDKYVYNLLQTTNLSDDAKEILKIAKELIRKSFEMRITYHSEHPEYHLNAWDAGWAQLKPMMKQYFKNDYDAFVQKYKAFEDRMRQGVYKFGFLNE
jgi:hypothetical protein